MKAGASQIGSYRIGNLVGRKNMVVDLKDIRHLVADWGGFEKLIAQLNETGDVLVEHNVTLTGRSGAPRQIDVLIRHKQGLYEYLVIIECKFWKENVGRLHVDALITTVQDLNAAKGVLFSVVGFESGAITLAKHVGIDLFKIREPTDEEWGLPGRHIDFFISYVTQSLANPSLPGATGWVQGPVNLNLNLGDEATITKTPIAPVDGVSTLEELIMAGLETAVRQAWPGEVLFGGQEGERRFWKTCSIRPRKPLVVQAPAGTLIVPEITFNFGIKIIQTRFHHDRGQKYAFLLAVEDCVKGVTNATAARVRSEERTQIIQISKEEVDRGGVMQNGSVMRISLKSYFPFEEVAGLAKGQYDDTIKPPSSP
jgi:hypothetical protein